MVNRVLDLQSRTVGEVMRPLAQVTTIPPELPTEAFLRLCRETGREHLPVRGPDAGRIQGVMSLRAVLYRADVDRERPVKDYLTPALELDAALRLEEALKRLQRSRQRLAIVTGRDREAVGLLTLGDVLRFLFGEVPR
jgi:CBS domain containing-hemolysin-like protein